MPALPTLPGITFRPRDPDRDAASLSALIDACAGADHIDPHSTLERLLSPAAARDLLARVAPEDLLVAEADGRLIGYNRISWWIEAGGIALFLNTGRVHPACRGRGVGTALIAWSEARSRELAPAVAPGMTWLYGANASSTETDAARLLRDHSYNVAFSLTHLRHPDIVDVRPVAIGGIDIRPPRVEDAEAMHFAQQAAWGDALFGLPEESDESLIGEIRETIASGNADLWRIAWDGQHIAGQVWCRVQEISSIRSGIFDELNTSFEFRRRGIARMLITHAIANFAAAGCADARLHTDTDNKLGARTLYEKLGFVALKDFDRYRKPMRTTEPDDSNNNQTGDNNSPGEGGPAPIIAARGSPPPPPPETPRTAPPRHAAPAQPPGGTAR
jgi:mycothiol synthase